MVDLKRQPMTGRSPRNGTLSPISTAFSDSAPEIMTESPGFIRTSEANLCVEKTACFREDPTPELEVDGDSSRKPSNCVTSGTMSN